MVVKRRNVREGEAEGTAQRPAFGVQRLDHSSNRWGYAFLIEPELSKAALDATGIHEDAHWMHDGIRGIQRRFEYVCVRRHPREHPANPSNRLARARGRERAHTHGWDDTPDVSMIWRKLPADVRSRVSLDKERQTRVRARAT
jgi:hypothetical protein